MSNYVSPEQTKELDFTVTEYPSGPVAKGKFNGIYLIVGPHGNGSAAFDVYFTTETPEGKPDFGKILNSASIDGTPEGIEEIADMYMERLKAGIAPQKMFVNIEEASEKQMRRIFEEMRGKDKK